MASRIVHQPCRGWRPAQVDSRSVAICGKKIWTWYKYAWTFDILIPLDQDYLWNGQNFGRGEANFWFAKLRNSRNAGYIQKLPHFSSKIVAIWTWFEFTILLTLLRKKGGVLKESVQKSQFFSILNLSGKFLTVQGCCDQTILPTATFFPTESFL